MRWRILGVLALLAVSGVIAFGALVVVAIVATFVTGG